MWMGMGSWIQSWGAKVMFSLQGKKLEWERNRDSREERISAIRTTRAHETPEAVQARPSVLHGMWSGMVRRDPEHLAQIQEYERLKGY